MRAQIRRSINNLYTVENDEGKVYQCRIKGKTLKIDKYEYNPIAVGDYVEIEPYSENEALVLSRLPRKSTFTRWNVKLERNQVMSANMDQVAIVASADTPPFRPRFIDRAIACAHGAEILLVLNKCDFLMSEEEADRWYLYRDLGFKTMAVSATTGENMEKLIPLLKGKTTAFVGQSGVGKSTLVNRILNPDVMQRTNEVCEKYQRGRHTTNHALLLESGDIRIIDTPGVREILVPYEDESLVSEAFPEFSHYDCAYPHCIHLNEPGCAVIKAVKEGEIDSDRYTSYLYIIASLIERAPIWTRNKFRKNKQ